MTSGTTTASNERNLLTGARELYCGECGYGIVVRREPPECPMCRSSAWSERPGFTRWN